MRGTRLWICCQLLLAWLWLTPEASWAAEDSIVLVSTKGSAAWHAAEARLIAELKAMGLRVLVLPAVTEAVPALHRQARRFEAVAAVQVLRRGDNGVIRIWLGQPWHVAVNLRNPDVVTLAVLPAAEFLYQRAVEIAVPQDAGLEPEASGAPVARSQVRSKSSPPVAYTPVRFHVRSEMKHALRLGVGPWFSQAETTPAVNVALGFRGHWFQLFAFEVEGFVHAIAHHIEGATGVDTLRLSGARAHVLLEPWPKSNVSLGIGPGLGVLRLDPRVAGDWEPAMASPLFTLRAELAAALAPEVDVLFVLTHSHATRKLAGYSPRAPDSPLLASGLDAMLAVEWHLE